MTINQPESGFSESGVEFTEPDPRIIGAESESQKSAAKEAGKEAKAEMQEMRNKVVNEISNKTKSVASDQKTRVVKRLEGASRAFRKTGESLKDEKEAYFAEYMIRLAEKVDQFSDYLREKEPDQILREVESVVQRRPGVAIGTGLIAGFLAGRLLKNVQPGVYQSDMETHVERSMP